MMLEIENCSMCSRFVPLLHIHPTEEWKVQPNLVIPEQVPEQAPHKLHTDNLNIQKLVQIIGKTELSVKDMLAVIGLKNREHFLDYYLNPAISRRVCLSAISR